MLPCSVVLTAHVFCGNTGGFFWHGIEKSKKTDHSTNVTVLGLAPRHARRGLNY